MFRVKPNIIVIVIILIAGLSYSSLSQSTSSEKKEKIHTLDELMKIMENSEMTYQIATLEEPVKSVDYSDKVVGAMFFRPKEVGMISTMGYKLDSSMQKRYEIADSYLFSGKSDSALFCFKEMIRDDSTLYFVLTLIGQCYEMKKDNDEAMKWFQLAIDKNYIDYKSRWFLADHYMAKGETEKALNEICLAKILNRNNPRLHASFDYILKADGRKVEDWYLTPQIMLKKESEKLVTISADKCWFGYALAKALWQYDPGFRKEVGAVEGQMTTTEEKECLVSTWMSFLNEKDSCANVRELVCMDEAFRKGFFNEFVFYECFLPKEPFLAAQLPEEWIEGIKKYMLEVRYPRK